QNGRGGEGLPHALDADKCSVRLQRTDSQALAEREGIGLVKLHVIDLDEEVLVERVRALLRHRDAVAINVHLHTELEIDSAVAVEVDAIRLPAVGQPVAIEVDDVAGRIEAPWAGNRPRQAPGGSR